MFPKISLTDQHILFLSHLFTQSFSSYLPDQLLESFEKSYVNLTRFNSIKRNWSYILSNISWLILFLFHHYLIVALLYSYVMNEYQQELLMFTLCVTATYFPFTRIVTPSHQEWQTILISIYS